MCLPNYSSNIDYLHKAILAPPGDPYMSTRPIKSPTSYLIKYMNKCKPTYNFRCTFLILKSPRKRATALRPACIHIPSFVPPEFRNNFLPVQYI